MPVLAPLERCGSFRLGGGNNLSGFRIVVVIFSAHGLRQRDGFAVERDIAGSDGHHFLLRFFQFVFEVPLLFSR